MEKVDDDDPSAGQYYVDTVNFEIRINTDDVGKEFQVVLEEELFIATFGAIDVFELLTDGRFQGEIITTEEPFTLEIPKISRISNPTYSSQDGTITMTYAAIPSIDNDRKPFRLYSNSVGFQTGDDPLLAEIFFADIPEEWVAGSILTLAGVVNLVNNPEDIPVETLTFTSTFDFATPGTEVVIFQTDPTGTFAISYQVDPFLGESESGFLTVVLNDTGQVLSQQAVTTPDPVPPEFTISGLAADMSIGDFKTISGTGVPDETVTLTSTGLDGEFNGDVAVVRLDGTWSVEGQIPFNIALEGTNVQVTGTHSNAGVYGFTPQVVDGTIELGQFTPAINHKFSTIPSGYVTGFPMTFLDVDNYRANVLIGVRIESPTLVFFDDNINATSKGDLTFSYTIPTSEEGKILTYTFTELFTATQVVLNDVAPQFDQTMVFTLDSGQGNLQAGEDSITGTLQASINYSIKVELFDEEGNQAGDNGSNGQVSSGTGISDVWTLLISANYLTGAGDPFLRLTDLMGIHDPVELFINPLPPVAVAEIVEDLNVKRENPSALIVQDSTIEFNVTSALNDTITASIPGFTPSTYIVNTTATERSVVLSVPIPLTQPLGNYTATFTTPRLPGFQVDISFEIVDPSLTLNSCPDSFLLTGNQQQINLNGDGFPGSIVNIDIVGLGLANTSTTVQETGNWNITINTPWVEPGAYTITVSSPGDNTFVCTGTHEPKPDWINDSIQLKQGDTGNTALFRGKPETIYNVVTTGNIINESFALFTDATGFNLVTVPDIPILTPTPETGTYIATEAANPSNIAIVGYSISERVPITISIVNPSLQINSLQILFTNSSFNVTGSTPTNGVYGLSAIGPVEEFSLTLAAADNYQALLETGSEAGDLTLVVSTVFQAPAQENFIVSPATFIEVPATLLVNNLYDVKILGEDGTLAEIEITSPADGTVVFETGEIGEVTPGEFSVVFDTTGLTDGVGITFKLSTEYFAFEPQERFLAGFSSGLPTAFVGEIGGDLGEMRAFNRDITDLNLVIDSTPINEAGLVADLVSGIDLSWEPPPGINVAFEDYLVEAYSSGSGWSTFAETTDTKVTLTDLELGYRILARFGGMDWSNYVYLNPGEAVVFGKTVLIDFSIGAHLGDLIEAEAPEEPVFYIGFLSESYDEDIDVLSIQSDFDTFIHAVPAEGGTFFIFITVPSQEEDSLSIEVGGDTDSNRRVIITPEDTPFFTV